MESYNRTLRVSFISTVAAIASIIALGFYIASHQTSSAILVVGIILVFITLGLGIFQVFDKVRALKTKRVEEQIRPVKITVEIGGEPITIETSDTERVEEILKLVQRLYPNHLSEPKLSQQSETDER